MAAKLGGAPWILKNLPYSEKPAAVAGINVNRIDLLKKVIVTCCCSTNRFFSRYFNNFSILDIENMTELQIAE